MVQKEPNYDLDKIERELFMVVTVEEKFVRQNMNKTSNKLYDRLQKEYGFLKENKGGFNSISKEKANKVGESILKIMSELNDKLEIHMEREDIDPKSPKAGMVTRTKQRFTEMTRKLEAMSRGEEVREYGSRFM